MLVIFKKCIASLCKAVCAEGCKVIWRSFLCWKPFKEDKGADNFCGIYCYGIIIIIIIIFLL